MIPENEFNFLKEIISNPISDARFDELVGLGTIDASRRDEYFEIAVDAPTRVFGDSVSKKTIAQSVKHKLIEREIIELIASGSPSKRTVVRLLIPLEDVEKQRPPLVHSFVRRGRPRKTDDSQTFTGNREPEQDESLRSVRALLTRDESDIDTFMNALAVIKRYPDFMVRLGIHIPESKE